MVQLKQKYRDLLFELLLNLPETHPKTKEILKSYIGKHNEVISEDLHAYINSLDYEYIDNFEPNLLHFISARIDYRN